MSIKFNYFAYFALARMEVEEKRGVMNSNLPLSKLLLGILVACLFFLLATVVFAGASGLFLMLGDSAPGSVFGWISAGTGLLFFATFLLLVFLHVGFSLFDGGLIENFGKEKTSADDEAQAPTDEA